MWKEQTTGKTKTVVAQGQALFDLQTTIETWEMVTVVAINYVVVGVGVVVVVSAVVVDAAAAVVAAAEIEQKKQIRST